MEKQPKFRVTASVLDEDEEIKLVVFKKVDSKEEAIRKFEELKESGKYHMVGWSELIEKEDCKEYWKCHSWFDDDEEV